MSIATLVTRGFGNGTLIGSISKVVTAGYIPNLDVSITLMIGNEEVVDARYYDGVSLKAVSLQIDGVIVW